MIKELLESIKIRPLIINEGAWGHGPLENDSASDWKWGIGDLIISEIKDKLQNNDKNKVYHAIGMWVLLKDRLDTQYSFFTDGMISNIEIDILSSANKLISDEEWINNYKKPEYVRDYLKHIINSIGDSND